MQKKWLYLVGIIFFSEIMIVKAEGFTVKSEVICSPSKVSMANEEIACQVSVTPDNGTLSSIKVSLADATYDNISLNTSKGNSGTPGVAFGDEWTYSGLILNASSLTISSRQLLGTIYFKVNDNCNAKATLNTVTYTSTNGDTFIGTAENEGNLIIELNSLNGSCSNKTQETTTENPSTGATLPSLFLSIMILLSLIIIINSKRNNKFYRL